MKLNNALLIAILTLVVSTAAFGQYAERGTYYTLYGQHFLNAGQSMRLVTDNPRYSDAEIVPCIRVAIIVSFFDSSVDVSSIPLRPLRRVIREIELDPGEAASFDFPATLACESGAPCPQLRRGVYAAVSVFTTPVEGEPIPARMKFSSTLSMVELGHTIFTLPAAEKGFDPQPDPPSSVQRPN